MLQHVIIPESQHPITSGVQPACTLLVIILSFRVLAAIHFDNHATLEAYKIHDIATNRLLAPEFRAPNLAALEPSLQPLLCDRQVAAKFSCGRWVHYPPS
jgi:hypothetical protein